MSNNVSCLNCFWREQCGGDTPCSFFDSVIEENIELMIEYKRAKFINEYNEYMDEWRK